MTEAPTLLLRPRPTRWLVLLAASLAFTVGGAVMVHHGDAWGWITIAVFALGMVAAVGVLLPRSAFLRLTPDGFEMRWLYRKLDVRWVDVTGFRTRRIGLHTLVVFDYAPSYRRSPTARAVATALAGAQAALPDGFGHSAEQLAALLDDWHRRATRGRG